MVQAAAPAEQDPNDLLVSIFMEGLQARLGLPAQALYDDFKQTLN